MAAWESNLGAIACFVWTVAILAAVASDGSAAKPQGAPDLQALVDAAAAPDGTGVANVPSGVYELKRPLMVTNWVSLALHPHAVLRAAADMDFLVVWDGQWKRELEGLWRRDNRFITGGVLDGAGRASCLLLTNCWHFTLRDVAFYDGREYGMLMRKGNEVFGTGLTFRTRMSGLEGNVALRVDASDNHFTDVVAIDYTTGIYVDWGANRLTRCHVWNGSLRAKLPDYPPDALERTVAFRIDGSGHVLRDCYADSAKVGYLIGGKGMRLFGCSYYKNRKMTGLDGMTVVRTSAETASALIHGGSFVKSAPNMTLEDGPGRIVWRDCLYPGWEADNLPADGDGTPSQQGLATSSRASAQR